MKSRMSTIIRKIRFYHKNYVAGDCNLQKSITEFISYSKFQTNYGHHTNTHILFKIGFYII